MQECTRSASGYSIESNGNTASNRLPCSTGSDPPPCTDRFSGQLFKLSLARTTGLTPCVTPPVRSGPPMAGPHATPRSEELAVCPTERLAWFPWMLPAGLSRPLASPLRPRDDTSARLFRLEEGRIPTETRESTAELSLAEAALRRCQSSELDPTFKQRSSCYLRPEARLQTRQPDTNGT